MQIHLCFSKEDHLKHREERGMKVAEILWASSAEEVCANNSVDLRTRVRVTASQSHGAGLRSSGYPPTPLDPEPDTSPRLRSPSLSLLLALPDSLSLSPASSLPPRLSPLTAAMMSKIKNALHTGSTADEQAVIIFCRSFRAENSRMTLPIRSKRRSLVFVLMDSPTCTSTTLMTCSQGRQHWEEAQASGLDLEQARLTFQKILAQGVLRPVSRGRLSGMETRRGAHSCGEVRGSMMERRTRRGAR